MSTVTPRPSSWRRSRRRKIVNAISRGTPRSCRRRSGTTGGRADSRSSCRGSAMPVEIQQDEGDLEGPPAVRVVLDRTGRAVVRSRSRPPAHAGGASPGSRAGTPPRRRPSSRSRSMPAWIRVERAATVVEVLRRRCRGARRRGPRRSASRVVDPALVVVGKVVEVPRLTRRGRHRRAAAC